MDGYMSQNDTFGDCLRALRIEKGLSQEKLASGIGRKKMTISDIEKGRNNPPQGEILERIIHCLMLSDSEAQNLRFLAAKERNLIPNDVVDYFFSDPYICAALRIAMTRKLSGVDLLALVSSDIDKEWISV